MTKSLLGGGAAAALLSASLMFYARPSIAEPLVDPAQKPIKQKSGAIATARTSSTETIRSGDAETLTTNDRVKFVKGAPKDAPTSQTDVSKDMIPGSTISVPAQSFVATAYSLRGRTASGKFVAKGLIAADRRVLPLGTRVHVQAGAYSGHYIVADTGGAIRGRKIDIWVPSTREAMRFGRQKVKLTVLSPAPLKKGTRQISALNN